MGFLGGGLASGLTAFSDPEEEERKQQAMSVMQPRAAMQPRPPTLPDASMNALPEAPAMPGMMQPRPIPAPPPAVLADPANKLNTRAILPRTPENIYMPSAGPDTRNYLEQGNDAISQRAAMTPRPTPMSPGEQNLARPMGINSEAIANQRSAPSPLLAPLAQARQDIGPQKHRGVFRTIGDVALGLAGGGLGGAILGGFKGGDWRYQHQLGQRAEEIGQQQAYDRQRSADALSTENTRADNDRLNTQIQLQHQERMAKIQPRQDGNWQPDTVIGEDGRPKRVLVNAKTGEIRETGYGAHVGGKEGDGPAVENPEWQRRASELRASMPVNEQGQPIDPKTGRPLSPYEIDTMIRGQLHSEGITSTASQAKIGPRPPAATPSPAEQEYGIGAPSEQPTGQRSSSSAAQPTTQPASQPFVSAHQQQRPTTTARFNASTGAQPAPQQTSRPGIAKSSSHADHKISAIEAQFGANSPEAARARELMAVLNRKKKK